MHTHIHIYICIYICLHMCIWNVATLDTLNRYERDHSTRVGLLPNKREFFADPRGLPKDSLQQMICPLEFGKRFSANERIFCGVFLAKPREPVYNRLPANDLSPHPKFCRRISAKDKILCMVSFAESGKLADDFSANDLFCSLRVLQKSLCKRKDRLQIVYGTI